MNLEFPSLAHEERFVVKTRCFLRSEMTLVELLRSFFFLDFDFRSSPKFTWMS